MVDRAPEREPQLLARRAKEIQGRHSGSVLEEGARVSPKLNDGQVIVHDDARRCKLRQHEPIGLTVNVGGTGQPGRGDGNGGVRRPRTRDRPVDDGAGRREIECQARRRRRAHVDLVLAVHDGKSREGARGLRGAEEKEPRFLQGVVQQRNDAILELRPEVNHQVPAADQIHRGEGWIPRDVVFREDAEISQVASNLIAPLGLGEEALQALLGDLTLDARGKAARARLLDDRGAQVRSEDLDRQLAARFAQEFAQANGDRVDLLARRATGDPDADRSVAGPALAQFRKDQRAECFDGVRIAEEAGHVDERFLAECRELGWIALEEVEIGGEIRDAVEEETPLEAPPYRRWLVAREVDASRLPHRRKDPQVVALVGAGRRHCPEGVRLRTQASELTGKTPRRQDEVDAPGRDRALRHAAVLGRRVLRERDSALALDGFDALGSVEAAAAEHDTSGKMIAIDCEGLEEPIDGEVKAALLDPRHELQDPSIDEQPRVRRHHVDVVGLDASSVGRAEHRQHGDPREDFDQATVVCRIEMVDDHERNPRRRAELADELRRGSEPACRGPHTYDGERGRDVRSVLQETSLG